MSLFDYPRVNFKGTIQLNPGTANNDDYAQQPSLLIPASFPKPYAGEVFGLIDSKTVQARTFGMKDDDFIKWVQNIQKFDVQGGGQNQQIPAEWNYYGDMTSKILPGTTVIGVQTGPGQVYAKVDPTVPATAVIGATVSYSGCITDINSEGSPPATQFFIDDLRIISGGKPVLSGKASKGASQWLNFLRNVNLQGDAGSGAYVYHVMRKREGAVINLPGFDPNISGVICRYYLYRRGGGTSDPNAIVALYKDHKSNAAVLEIAGTFAPLLADEEIFTLPVGRLLISTDPDIPATEDPKTKQPLNNNNTNGKIALAPAVLQRIKDGTKDRISADFSGTFPDYYHSDTDNPKFDFGPVTLVVSGAKGSAPIGPVTYADTGAGDRCGWIFDFDVSPKAAAVLQDPEAKFSLQHAQFGAVLDETDYYFVTNQQAIYAEQNEQGDRFLNQGTYEAATVAVYHRGQALGAADCPPITVWGYKSVPIQIPGQLQTIATGFKPEQPLNVDTSQPGNWLFTFTIEPRPAGFPPPDYNPFLAPNLTVTYAPAISLRILPNDEDFSQYYVDPHAKEPVCKPGVPFLDVVYKKVLRTYYLLYPIMNLMGFMLNSEDAVKANAQPILDATDPKQWMTRTYMPRTRDMSKSRRTLLRAWCRMVLGKGAGA